MGRMIRSKHRLLKFENVVSGEIVGFEEIINPDQGLITVKVKLAPEIIDIIITKKEHQECGFHFGDNCKIQIDESRIASLN